MSNDVDKVMLVAFTVRGMIESGKSVSMSEIVEEVQGRYGISSVLERDIRVIVWKMIDCGLVDLDLDLSIKKV